MGALALLLGIFLLFGGHEEPQRKCPYLLDEKIPIYEPVGDNYVWKPQEELFFHDYSDDFATRTRKFRLSKKTGYKTDLKAVEFNKKVKECEIANGEFTK